MARAYRVKDVYGEYHKEISQLQEAGILQRDHILMACPKCGEKYNLFEEVGTSEADVENHKEVLREELERTCPGHPGAFVA